MIKVNKKNIFLVFVWVVAVTGGLLVTPVGAQDAPAAARIAAVNSDRILRESVLAKSAEADLKKEFSPREKELQKLADRLKPLSVELSKETSNASSAERAKRQQTFNELNTEFQRKQAAFNEDLARRRNEELAAVLMRANQVIKQIAEKEKYDVILQEAVYVSSRIDITDQVLKALAAASKTAQ